MTRSMVAMRDVSLLTYLLTYLYMISSGTRQQHHSHCHRGERQLVTQTVVIKDHVQGGAKKRGHQPSYLIANTPKTP